MTNLNNQVQSYRNNGYLLIKDFFTPDEMNSAKKAINEILNTDTLDKVAELEPNDNQIIRRIWAPVKRHSYFRDLAYSNNKLLDVIESLIGPNIAFHYSKLNMKGPSCGSKVEWHQDFSYYPHTNTDLVSCLIYLDDATVENGCLQVIPGSHRYGLLDHYVDGFFRGKVQNDAIEKNIDKKIFLEAPAGSVIFLHCLSLHASDTNLSNKARRAFLPAYRAADTFPIYYGPHAAHNEKDVVLLRGEVSRTVRTELGNWILPIAECEFSSLYEIQEGKHLQKESNNEVGYFSQV